MKNFSMAVVLILILVAAPALAMEVPFRDGSVVDAVNYTVTGSYVMLEMGNGAKVAYDVADIDLDALREAEAAAAGPQADEPEAPSATLGNSGSLRVPEEETNAGGLTITDQHVKHIRGSGIAGPEDETEEQSADDDGVPEGFEQGGSVLLNNVKVTPTEGGEWQVSGDVINRAPDTVTDVRANLEAPVPEGDPWTASVGVSGALGPDEKASFTHTFAPPASAGEGWRPQVSINVIWMKTESRIEPEYNRTAPHPSALPRDRGGVGGVDVVNDVID